MNDLIFSKVAQMYALSDRFKIINLSKEHAKRLIDLVVNTDMAKILLQIAQKLYKDGFDTGFMITTRPATNEMVILIYVSKVDQLYPYLDALKATQGALLGMGIKLEMDTIANASRVEQGNF